MNEIEPKTWLTAILSQDAVTFEDAYWGDRPASNEVVPEIIAKLSEIFDPYTRGKLIELLGECGDKSILPILEAELKNPDPSLKEWAAGSIDALIRGEPWQKNPKYI